MIKILALLLLKLQNMFKQYFVYILTNKKNGTFYIGITNNLLRRVYEHKAGIIEGFSTKYHLNKLVYFEVYEDVKNAILREKKLKRWHRMWKIELIEKINPEWEDLYKQLIE